MKTVVSRLLILFLALGLISCSTITWQKATRTTVSALAATTDVVARELASYYGDRCAEVAVQVYENGCDLKGELSTIQCAPLKGCLNEMQATGMKIKGIYQLLKLVVLAVDLGDKETSTSYLEKGTEALKTLYALVRQVAPNALPKIPLLEGK